MPIIANEELRAGDYYKIVKIMTNSDKHVSKVKKLEFPKQKTYYLTNNCTASKHLLKDKSLP